MARGEQRSNREKKKPKKEKAKTIAAAPSQKGEVAGWQPNLGSGKKEIEWLAEFDDQFRAGIARYRKNAR